VSYALKLGGAAIAFLLIGYLVILIFGGLWTRVGLGAALIVVFGGFMLMTWRSDSKAKRSREGLERI
jgi:hypothetical protein